MPLCCRCHFILLSSEVPFPWLNRARRLSEHHWLNQFDPVAEGPFQMLGPNIQTHCRECKAQGTTHGISCPYFMVFLWYFPCIISLAVSTSIIHLRTRLEFWSPNQGTFNSTFNRQPQVCFFQISDLVEDRVRVPWRVWEGNPIGLPRKL